MNGERMSAADVRSCLTTRWPDSEYLLIDEAPEDASRQGRKIDLLVVTLWRSRGYQLDAVEIKVSASDWTRELENEHKADYWWRHSHRFWVAVPVTLAARVKSELPQGWGLLACERGKPTKVVVRPPRRDAEPLPWPCVVGLLRAAADSGFNALNCARQSGYDQGFEAGRKAAERESGESFTAARLKELRERVDNFEAAAGVRLDNWNAEDLGHVVRMVHAERIMPGYLVDGLDRAIDNIERQAKALADHADRIRTDTRKVAQIVANGDGDGAA